MRGEGGVFHLTHRCHNRAFLLRFARDREAYRAKLREQLAHFEVALLDCRLTSNHVHLLVDAEEVKREPRWTESLAVGSLSLVERIKPLILSRRETKLWRPARRCGCYRKPSRLMGKN